MKTAKRVYGVVASILCTWLLFAVFFGGSVEAKPQYSAKEKTACKTCHVKPVPKKDDKSVPKKDDAERNDVGKCYERCNHGKLDQCKKDPNSCKA